MTYSIQTMWINMFDSHNDIKTYFLMTYSIQTMWINMFDSHNDIKLYFFNDIFDIGCVDKYV